MRGHTNTRALEQNKITGENNNDKYLALVHLCFSLTSHLLFYCIIQTFTAALTVPQTSPQHFKHDMALIYSAKKLFSFSPDSQRKI